MWCVRKMFSEMVYINHVGLCHNPILSFHEMSYTRTLVYTSIIANTIDRVYALQLLTHLFLVLYINV